MTIQTQAWENRLLAWAHEALENHTPGAHITADSATLHAAYQHCATMTRVNSRTFFLSSGLLPTEKRRAVRALYAFCRVTDDIVDRSNSDSEAQERLEQWRRVIMSPTPPENDPVALAWAATRAQYNIPSGYAQQLIDGVARDFRQKYYSTFDDLAEYSYGVASTVGLMAMHIIGYQGGEAVQPAVRLGVALQMTNILRDVREDWINGRVYLPQDELDVFGVRESDLVAGRITDNWRAFMRFQIERTNNLYAESLPGVALLDPDGRFAITAAGELYRAILSDIEAHDYDVFSRRAHIGAASKLRRLPRIWWRSKHAAS